MTYRRRTPVPSTGTKKTADNNGLSRSARDLRELPPGSGLLNPKYWMIGLGVWALVAMFAWSALASTGGENAMGTGQPRQDAAGRHYIYGNGGGLVERANVRFRAMLRRGEPVHMAPGYHTSAAATAITVVMRIPGSCMNEDARLGLHLLSVPGGSLDHIDHQTYADNLPPGLGRYYRALLAAEDYSFHTFDPYDLREEGVPVPICVGDGSRVRIPLEVE